MSKFLYILQLPFTVSIVKHPQEIDGKSTAIHAAILAPESVKIYTYPELPPSVDKSNV